jgi:hypothetical protein
MPDLYIQNTNGYGKRTQRGGCADEIIVRDLREEGLRIEFAVDLSPAGKTQTFYVTDIADEQRPDAYMYELAKEFSVCAELANIPIIEMHLERNDAGKRIVIKHFIGDISPKQAKCLAYRAHQRLVREILAAA